MALPSIIARRKSLAILSIASSSIRLAKTLGIEPPEELPSGLRDPTMKDAVWLECLAEFFERSGSSAEMMLAVATTTEKKVKHADKQQ